MGLEGGQQGGGPTAEQRCLLATCPLPSQRAQHSVHSSLCSLAVCHGSADLTFVLLPKTAVTKHREHAQVSLLLLLLFMPLHKKISKTRHLSVSMLNGHNT